MQTPEIVPVRWQIAAVTSPTLPEPVTVLVARNVPYLPQGNRLQSFNLYLPHTAANAALVDTPVRALPAGPVGAGRPHVLVHVHGGAWRDPLLDATSIEPTVAHAFAAPAGTHTITAVAALNYTLTQFPTHPTLPYATGKTVPADPAREAVHPRHIHDVLLGLHHLRTLGLTDRSFVLSGHSCGACLLFQAVLQAPWYYGLANVPDTPRPAALLGVNGLYDLPALVDGLDAAHEHLRAEYATLLANAFGAATSTWPAASPACFEPATLRERVRTGHVPPLVLLDQSADDQLVPLTQLTRLAATLRQVDGLHVIRGHRAVGLHAAPWQRGDILWHSVQDLLAYWPQPLSAG